MVYPLHLASTFSPECLQEKESLRLCLGLFLCPHLCSHKSAGHKKDNERCALEGFLFIVQNPLQVRQSLWSKVGNPASATRKSLDAQHQGFFYARTCARTKVQGIKKTTSAVRSKAFVSLFSTHYRSANPCAERLAILPPLLPETRRHFVFGFCFLRNSKSL